MKIKFLPILTAGSIFKLKVRLGRAESPASGGIEPALALILIFLNGCISFPIVQAPGPKEYQVQASKEISTESVKALADAQKEKVVAMKEVAVPIAVAKVEAIKTIASESAKNTKDPEALSNINANAVAGVIRVGLEDKILREIGVVDGTAKVIGNISGKGIESTETSTAQYGMYVAGQTALGLAGIPEAQRQFQAISRWGLETLIPMIAGPLGGGGLIAGLLLAIRKAGRRKELLEADGKVIEKHGSSELKKELAKAHASIPMDAKKEHGLV